MIITISNLFPRPDQPTRGLYNDSLFREMARKLLVNGYELSGNSTNNQQPITNNQYLNICLVPEWRFWRWPAIRRWAMPEKLLSESPASPEELLSCQVPQLLSESPAGSLPLVTEQPNNLTTEYLPVFYLPLLGRSLNWWFYYRALRKKYPDLGKRHAPVWGGCPHPPDSRPVREADEDIRPTTATPVFYVPWLYPDGAAVARVTRECGVRLWLMALGSDTFHLESSIRRRKILEACEQAEGIVCVAQVLADRLAAAGVPVGKLHVVPNGVDTSLFRVRNKDELLSCRVAELSKNGKNLEAVINNPTTEQLNNSRTILFVGNLVPVKGPDILLKAFGALGEGELLGCQVPELLSESPASPGELLGCSVDKLLSESPKGSLSSATEQPSNLTTHMPPRLVVIGDGPERARLAALARDLGIADRVHFLGRRSPAEVALWMNVADMLCLSSRSEGMPNVVLEARASGLPVVATPAGAIPELPLDQACFRVVKSCSPVDLAEGLREMLARGVTMRTSDPAIVSWGLMAGKIMKLIEEGKE